MCSDSPASHHPRFIHPAAANNTPSSSRSLSLSLSLLFVHKGKALYTHSDVEVAAEQGIFMPFKLLPSNCAALAEDVAAKKATLRVSSLPLQTRAFFDRANW